MEFLRYLIWSMLGLFCVIGSNAYSQNKIDLGKAYLDPSIRSGKLGNGLTYYLKHIESGPKKLDMNFYIKVGNYHQRKNELEFSHAIEHLAFKCAEHFPVNLMNDIGMFSSLGMARHDIQGMTSFLYTRYYFNVPSDNWEAVDTGLLWFHDITNLELTDDRINNERGPLRQEVIFRQGDDLEGFVLKKGLESKLFPCNEDFSNIFAHNKNFSAESLREFYNEWYHPDRMAVVIVGKITDLDSLEGKVKRRFSDLEGRNPARLWSDCRSDYLNGPDRFTVLQRGPDQRDYEKGSWEMELYMRDQEVYIQNKDKEGLRHGIFWAMLNKLINRRFRETVKDYNSSVTEMFGRYPDPIYPGYQLHLSGILGTEQKILEKAMGILIGAKKYGFAPQEWDLAKEELLKAMHPSDTLKTTYWIGQIERHYVHGETLPRKKAVVLYQWLSGFSLTEFNNMLDRYLLYEPNDIGIIAPPGQSYSEPEVRGWIGEALAQVPERYSPPEVPAHLLGNQEINGLKESGHRELESMVFGAREYLLDNGAKVVLDTTGPNKKSIYLHGFSPRGASCFPKEDYYSAINAPLVVRNAGVGMLDKFAMDRYLEGTSLRYGVEPYIDYRETGIKGESELEDLEKMLQLVYLYSTRPRKSGLAFEDWKLREQKKYINPTYSLENKDFEVMVRGFLGDSSKVTEGTLRFQGLSKTNMDMAYAIYQKLFNSPKDFTFLISGDFSIDTILPLVKKYLGNIPDVSASWSCPKPMTRQKKLPKGPIYERFSVQDLNAPYKLKGILYSLRYLAKVGNPMEWKEHINVDVLGALMYSKLQGFRYEKEAALYSPTAWAIYNRETLYYDFGLLLHSESKELEHLRRLSDQMVNKLKTSPVSPKLFSKVIESRILPKIAKRRKSSFHKNQELYNWYAFGEPWVPLTDMEAYIKSLKPEDIRETANKYFMDKNKIEFEMCDGKGYQEGN